MFTVKGHVKIVVRDKDTEEVKRVHEEDNVITASGYTNLSQAGALSTRNISSNVFMYIGPRRTGSYIDAGYANTFAVGGLSPSAPTHSIVDKTVSTPYYLEYLNRFQPGSSTRTIYVVGICDADASGGQTAVRTAAQLASPCTQTNTEILDIYYRVQSLEPLTDPYAYTLPVEIDKAWVEWLSGDLTAPTGMTHLALKPSFTTVFPIMSKVPPGKYWNRFAVLTYSNIPGQDNNNDTISTSNTNTSRYGQRRVTYALTTAQNLGHLEGSALQGGTLTNVHAGLYLTPTSPIGWQPVQPIHKHNALATSPFLYPDTLASGTGTVNATGTDWTNPDYPEHYRVNITTTGDLATPARYAFYKRNVFNFERTANYWQINAGDSLALPAVNNLNPTNQALGSHYNTTNVLSAHSAVERIDDTHVAFWETHGPGLQVTDLVNNIYRLFDSATTPTVAVTSVQQVIGDDNGFAWVACGGTGLYKIWIKDVEIVGVIPGLGGTWKVKGDQTTYYTVADSFNVELNTGVQTANATYTIASLTYDAGTDTTAVVVNETIPTDAALLGSFAITGSVTTGAGGSFQIGGDFTADFVAGLAFTVSGSTGNDGSYTVASSSFSGGLTTIVVNETISDGTADGSIIPETSNGIVQLNKVYHYTTSDTNIPANNCYGVGVGESNSIWAVFNGGLRYTTDSGANWLIPANQPVAGDFPSSDWSTIMFMRVQKDSPSHRMALVTSTNPSAFVSGIVWWSDAGTVAGPTITSWSFFGSQSVVTVKVSTTGGFWTYVDSSARYSTLTWGSVSTGTEYGYARVNATTDASPTPDFFYDSYGSAYVSIQKIGSTSGEQNSIIDTTLVNYGLCSNANNNGNRYNLHMRRGVALETNTQTASSQHSLGMVNVNTTVDALNGADRMTQEFVWDRYHYDSGTSTWKLEWHADAVDSAAVGPYDGTRYNFPTESHTWTGRSSILVPTTALSAHITSALTVATYVNLSAKLTFQRTSQTLFSYYDAANVSNNIKAYIIDDAGTDIVIDQNGTTYTIGTTAAPSLSANHTVALAFNGTAVEAFVDGTSVGTQTLGTAVDFSSGSGRFVIGGIWYAPDCDAMSFSEGFVRGSMTYIQLDPTPWTTGGGQAASFNASPTTYTTGAEVVYYKLTEAFDGVGMARETKAIHSGFADILNGIQVKFTDGTPSPSFVATDYYTFGVFDGVMKDNAISYTWGKSWYYYPIEHDINVFTPATIPATPTNVTEKVCWRNYGESASQYLIPGVNSERLTTGALWSFQSTSGDFIYESRTSDNISAATNPTLSDTQIAYMGVHNTTTNTASTKWSIRFKPDGSVDIAESGVVVMSSVTTFTYDDIFQIRRVGSTVSYWKNGGLLYTSLVTSTELVWMYSQVSNNAAYTATFHGQQLTYDLPAYTVKVGDSGALTGWYDSRFYNFDAAVPEASEVYIDGAPAAITVDSLTVTLDTVATPASGAVTFVPDNGLLVFNSADAGKTVTGKFTVVYNKP